MEDISFTKGEWELGYRSQSIECGELSLVHSSCYGEVPIMEEYMNMYLMSIAPKLLEALEYAMANVSILPIEKYNEIHALIDSARKTYEG